MINRTIIYGPPGTGKTSRLLALMEQELRAGTPPDRIAFVSFTRNAVQEARSRAQQKFRVGPKELQWVRTLHSLAFAALGLTNKMVMADYGEFAAANGFTLNRRNAGLESVFSDRRGDDRLLHAMHLVRSTGLPLDQVVKRWRIEGVSWLRYDTLCERLEAWKKERGLFDWSDMIEEFLRQDSSVPVEVAFIDEAQDLTPQQWRMVEVAFRGASRVYIAGDDDQAIYEWSGADTKVLLTMDAQREVLGQSHRVPRAVQRFALGITERISQRQPKDWRPVEKEGVVERVQSLNALPLNNGERWLVLARTAYPLAAFKVDLERAGIAYTFEGASSVDEEEAHAFKLLQRLRAGGTLSAVEARKLFAHCAEQVPLPRSATISARDVRDFLTDERALSRWRPDRIRYVARVGDAAPRVELSTIHGAKGSEAHNVVLCTDMSRAPAMALRTPEYSDAEHRVWYVGATRAQERLFLLRANGEHAYPINNQRWLVNA